MSGLIFIISAPSGSGKSTLVSELRKVVAGLEFSISYTTRKPRGSEQNGREYYFVSREEFERMLRRDEFLEHAEVFGNYYGTARRFLEDARRRGQDLLLDIDVQGAGQIKKRLPEAVSIFVLPPSRAELERRLHRRSEADAHAGHPVTEETIQRRLHTATKEIEKYPDYDYILVNDRLEQSIDELKAIVLSERLTRAGKSLTPAEAKLVSLAESCRQQNMQPRLQPILESFGLAPAPRAD
ncbi:MAG TPA: guanylate kinase [Terriglobales bacterium]|nr:guanylate kinase [Terriglobales bacterium]